MARHLLTILGYRKKKNKERITSGTWQKIEERKKLKAKMLRAKSPRLPRTGLRGLHDEGQGGQAFAKELAGEAERATARGETSALQDHKATLWQKYQPVFPCQRQGWQQSHNRAQTGSKMGTTLS